MKTVIAGVITRPDQRILIARRAPEQVLAGYWEFPGGKIEAGESPEKCLAREIEEEMSLRIEDCAFICEEPYHYQGGSILLKAYGAKCGEQQIIMTVHDQTAWVLPNEMYAYNIAPADLFIVEYLNRQK